ERNPVRLDADGDLEPIPLVIRLEYRNGVLAPVGGEHQLALFGNQRTGHRGQAGDRFNVAVLGAVDHIDRVVCGMRNIETIGGRMNVGVIEAAFRSMRRKFDVSDETKGHGAIAPGGKNPDPSSLSFAVLCAVVYVRFWGPLSH